MNFDRLYEIREYNDLKQKDIANIVGVKQQTYSLWEKGTKIIPMKHLNTISNFYNVSLDYILGLSDTKNYRHYNKIDKIDKVESGKRLKMFRNKYGLSLRDLAKVLNTTSSTISAYETGKTLILTAFAYQISKKYKISIDWLIGKKI